MITHIVLFRLKDRRPESVEEARRRLASLMGRVESLRSLEVGADVLHKERSYDIALTARFASLDGLEAYQLHPYHVEVGGWIKGRSEAIAAVDYES